MTGVLKIAGAILLVILVTVFTGCPNLFGGNEDGGSGGETSGPVFIINDDAEIATSRTVELFADVPGAVSMRYSNRPFADVDDTLGISAIHDIGDPGLITIIEPAEYSTNLVSLLEKYSDELTNEDLLDTLDGDDEAISILNNHAGVVSVVNNDPTMISVLKATPVAPFLIEGNEDYAPVLKNNSGAVSMSSGDDGTDTAIVNLRNIVTTAEAAELSNMAQLFEGNVERDFRTIVVTDRGEYDGDSGGDSSEDSERIETNPNTGEGTATTGWLPYSRYKNWMLPSGNSERAVYAQFKDADGNLILDTRDRINLEAEYSDEITEYLADMKVVPPPGDSTVNDPVASEPVEDTDAEDGMYCTVTPYTVRAEFDENICLNPGSGIIYPGSIMDAASIADGSYLPILTTIERGPGYIYISDVANIETVGVAVDRITPASSRQSVVTLLQQAFTSGDGSVGSDVTNQSTTFEIIDAYDESYLAMSLGAEFHYGGGSGSVNFNYANTEVETRLFIKFMQTYYTVNFEYPRSPADLFVEGTTAQDIEDALASAGTGTVPVYVSMVRYGRMAYYSLESSMSKQEIGVALEAAYSNAVAGGSVNFGLTLGETSSETTTKGQIFGGSVGASGAAVTSIDEFFTWIADDTSTYNSLAELGSVPIAYQLNYIGDNGPAKLGFYNEYNIRNCTPVDNDFTVGNVRIELLNVEETDKDLIGTLTVRAFEDLDLDGRYEDNEAVDALNSNDGEMFHIYDTDPLDLSVAWDATVTSTNEHIIQVSGDSATPPYTGMPVPCKEIDFTFSNTLDQDYNRASNPYIEVAATLMEVDGTSGDFSYDKVRVNNEITTLDQVWLNDGYEGEHIIGPFESENHTRFNILYSIWPTAGTRPPADYTYP